MEQPRKPRENLLGAEGSKTASGDATPGQGSSEQRDHDANIRSADQRATALAAVASLAATLALSGAAIIIDMDKWRTAVGIRHLFGVVLIAAVVLFSISAFRALRGHGLELDDGAQAQDEADEMDKDKDGKSPLEDLSIAKHRAVHSSMWFLWVGIACVALLTVLAFVARLTG